MYRTDRAYYIWLVDVLRQAYMDDKLIAGSPCECGTGNIIYAAALEKGYSMPKARELSFSWQYTFCTMTNRNLNKVLSLPHLSTCRRGRSNDTYTQVLLGCDSAGLSLVSLPKQVMMDLEWEFETTEKGETPDEIMFNRLIACISVLDKYFGIPPIVQEETKESFIKVKPSLCSAKTREMALTM